MRNEIRRAKIENERLQREVENNQVVLAIRQAETTNMELELENNKVLLAMKRVEVRKREEEDLLAMEASEESGGSVCSNWETDDGVTPPRSVGSSDSERYKPTQGNYDRAFLQTRFSA